MILVLCSESHKKSEKYELSVESTSLWHSMEVLLVVKVKSQNSFFCWCRLRMLINR